MKCFNSRNSDISGTCHYLSSQNRLLDCFSCSTGWSCNFVILTKTTRFLVHLVIDTILFVYTLKTFYNIVWFTYFFLLVVWVFLTVLLFSNELISCSTNIMFYSHSPPPSCQCGKNPLDFLFLEDLYSGESVNMIKENFLTVKLIMACDFNLYFLMSQNELPLIDP